MSHELPTPLRAVFGYSNLLPNDPALSRAQRKRLEIVRRSGRHLLHLIDDTKSS